MRYQSHSLVSPSFVYLNPAISIVAVETRYRHCYVIDSLLLCSLVLGRCNSLRMCATVVWGTHSRAYYHLLYNHLA